MKAESADGNVMAKCRVVVVSGGSDKAKLNSKVTSAKIPVSAVNAPTASHAGGQLEAGTVVTLTTSTSGADIYYTSDDSEPTTEGTKYTGSVVIAESTVLKAIAAKDGYKTSEVYEVSYTVPTVVNDTPIISVGSIKMMIWNSMSDMSPLMAASSIL